MQTPISRRGLIASVLAVVLLCFTGCGGTSSNEKSYSKEQIIAVDVHTAYAALKLGSNVINVNTKHARKDCPTGGWITQGDGHKSRCPSCDPPYISTDEEPKAVEPEPVVEKKVVPIPPAPQKPVQTQPKVNAQKKVQYYDQRTRRWYYYYSQ